MKQANPGEHKVFILYRELAKPIIPLVYKTGLTPNQITVGRALVFVSLSLIFFYHSSYLTNLIAIMFFHMFKLFDVIDGEIARLRNKSSLAGHWLDSIIDFLGDGFIMIGVTVGAVRSWVVVEFPWVSSLLNRDLMLAAGLLAIFSFGGNYLLFEQIEKRFKAFTNQSVVLERLRHSHDASKMDKIIVGLLFLPSLFWRVTFSVGYILTGAILLNQIIAALILISVLQFLRLFTLVNVQFQVLRKNEQKDNILIRLIKETCCAHESNEMNLIAKKRQKPSH